MLDDNVVTLVLVGHVQLVQQVVGWLAHLHRQTVYMSPVGADCMAGTNSAHVTT